MSTSSCDSVLVNRTNYSASSSSARLAWLKLVTEDNYEKAKMAGGASVADMFSGDFNSFSEKRRSYFQQESYEYTIDQARSDLQIGVPNEALEAWVECLKHQTNNLYCVVRDVTRTTVRLEIGFTGVGVNLTQCRVDGINVAVAADNFTGAGPFEGDAIVILYRDESKPITGYVMGMFGNGTLTVPFFVAPSIAAPHAIEKWEHNAGQANECRLRIEPKGYDRTIAIRTKYAVLSNFGGMWFELNFFVDGESIYYRKSDFEASVGQGQIVASFTRKLPAGKEMKLTAIANNNLAINRELSIEASG